MADKPKQTEIPGLERPKIKEIEDAADKYESTRDRRMALTEKEVEQMAELVAQMKAHKVQKYRLDEDRYVELVPSEKAKVRKVKHEAPDDEE